MDYLLKVVALLVTASAIAIHILSRAKKSCPANLPPGSMGIPVIGQSLGFLRGMHFNSIDQWFWDRIDRYGLVSKLSLFGKPTVLLVGPAANKFMFFSSSLPPYVPLFAQRVIGEKTILSLSGDDHLRIRGALMEFLKPDMLKLYISRIDAEVRQHLEENWAGRTAVTVLPLMKRLTLGIISSLLFGLERGAVRDALAIDFTCILEGALAIPVNLPFTAFSRSIKARRRAERLLNGIMRERKAMLEQGKVSPNNDLISRLVSMTDDHGEQLLSSDEIIDNCILALIAGHDTTSILMTFMVRHLGNDPATLAAMVQGK
jgi:cytochrome P450